MRASPGEPFLTYKLIRGVDVELYRAEFYYYAASSSCTQAIWSIRVLRCTLSLVMIFLTTLLLTLPSFSGDVRKAACLSRTSITDRLKSSFFTNSGKAGFADSFFVRYMAFLLGCFCFD